MGTRERIETWMAGVDVYIRDATLLEPRIQLCGKVNIVQLRTKIFLNAGQLIGEARRSISSFQGIVVALFGAFIPLRYCYDDADIALHL